LDAIVIVYLSLRLTYVYQILLPNTSSKYDNNKIGACYNSNDGPLLLVDQSNNNSITKQYTAAVDTVLGFDVGIDLSSIVLMVAAAAAAVNDTIDLVVVAVAVAAAVIDRYDDLVVVAVAAAVDRSLCC
jgi:hypothetical protein